MPGRQYVRYGTDDGQRSGMTSSGYVLVIDDDDSMREACRQTLEDAAYGVATAKDGYAGLKAANEESFDAVVLDMKMPGLGGMEVLEQLKGIASGTSVIVITAYGTIEVAVKAMQRGALDFLTKPFEPEALIAAVDRAAANRRCMLESICRDSPFDGDLGSEVIVGRSHVMLNIAQLIKRVAPTDSTILIYGETGTGKELVARTIHRLSARCDKPFVTVDCGTLVETLFESELFGHIRGAFTGAVDTTKGKFELADGGTIFLDEIANISVSMQARLLRVVQEREFSKVGSHEKRGVDVRILAATNKDLLKEIVERRFREDLFYRLNVVPVHLPPLRERRTDIPVLARYFLKRFCERTHQKIPSLAEGGIRVLENHGWPGNVRELKNTIERAVVTCEEDAIEPGDLQIPVPVNDAASAESGSLAELERQGIVNVLRQFDGHISKAAEHLGIHRQTLREKMRKYRISC